LSTADVNTVFQTSDVPSIYGHLNQEPFSLHYIKEAGVFVPEECDVDLTALALSSVTLTQKGQPFVKGEIKYLGCSRKMEPLKFTGCYVM
jgi:hypothetical protein